jgi:hypothetical protein
MLQRVNEHVGYYFNQFCAIQAWRSSPKLISACLNKAILLDYIRAGSAQVLCRRQVFLFIMF